MEEKTGRLLKWKKRGKASPYVLDINPTDLCNLNCRSCWQRNPKFKDLDSSYQLSKEKLLEVIDEGIELGIEKFEITGGGEPLMRKEAVLEVMKKIKRNCKRGNLTTNGTLLEKDDLDLLMDINWDSITFSIDGPNQKVNNYLRGEGSFESIISSLKYLKEEKGGRPEIKFNTVISNRNYDKLEEILELASKFKVKFVSFETLTVHSNKGKELKLSENEKEELSNEIGELKEVAEKKGIKTNLEKLERKFFDKSNQMEEILGGERSEKFSEIPCYEPWYHLVIKVDGSAQPCCLYDSQEENVKEKSLKDIWYSETFQKIRKSIRKGNFSEYCKICNASQVIANKELQEKLKRGN